jgi:hypothetical protein
LKRVGIAAVIAACSSASFAGTSGEEASMVINRVNATDFEVVETRSMGAADFWCGASTFVIRRNGLSELTPIYLKRGRAASQTAKGRKGVVFSTSAKGLPPAQDRITVSVDRPGDMIKASLARRFCRDAFTRSTK